MVTFENTREFAVHLDETDPLGKFRERFYIPLHQGKPCIYFAGNSLGLQSKSVQEHVMNDLEDWANFGVEGHVHARIPWIRYNEIFPQKLAPILGAKPAEIVVMNALTVNLHLLLVSFYRPTASRYKIICEAKAFPSDQYALQSQALLHGRDPGEVIIEIAPREGSHILRKEDILSCIREHGAETAVVMIGGVNYYTGQVLDMPSIAAAAHQAGAYCGFDLAHAVGNVPLQLHDWEVDFACWCSYKYLNSGPGAVAGAFVHDKFFRDPTLVRLAGWVGTNKERRFRMDSTFDPIPSAEGWQLSTTQVLNMSAHGAALDLFEEAGFENVVDKMKKLSAYLMFVLDEIGNASPGRVIEIITPRDGNEHGCQVSILLHDRGKAVFDSLKQQGVIVDWREPNVIRLAPVPLYNTYEEVYTAGQILKKIIAS